MVSTFDLLYTGRRRRIQRAITMTATKRQL